MTAIRYYIVAVLCAAGLSGCHQARDAAPAVACPSWQTDVAPQLAEACTSCHGLTSARAGNYDLRTYHGVLGAGSDASANVIAGDEASRLLAVLREAPAGSPHAGRAELLAMLTTWVAQCDVRYSDSGIHGAGIQNPASDEFHGAELRARVWDFSLCATCHGEDFDGGAASAVPGASHAPSCRTCHAQGPTACDTCHRAVPTTGAHRAHTAVVPCVDCHVVPTQWSDDGHVRRGGEIDDAPAEVAFHGLAARSLPGGGRLGPPRYVAATQRCENIYCHGDALRLRDGSDTQPTWRERTAAGARCERCHGKPPRDHASNPCEMCHPAGAAHLNGTVEVGALGAEQCHSCHGDAMSPAPPRDLAGNVFTTARGVGAHRVHLDGPARLAAPVACATCHLVPATVNAVGHIDSSLPAEVSAALGWDAGTQTCATAWCHGAARPPWTSAGQVVCGSCHGLPPVTPAHSRAASIATCVTCHAASVDVFGNVRLPAHANGVVDGN